MPSTTAATTRTMTRRAAPEDGRRLLARGEVVRSPETGCRYMVEQPIGEGGFGQAFRARVLTRTQGVDPIVCLKASTHIDAWLREAYFGRLLDGQPRALRTFDVFPLARGGGRIVYVLALEYARHGDLRVFMRRAERPWPERRIRTEIAGILGVLGKLHRGQMLHRDLTPMNVFVCEGPALKLGDFGIARPQSDRRGVTARTMNALTAPSDVLEGSAPKWQARDDVYQMGQLLGMLVRGDAERRIGTREIRGLACSDHLKEIIHRCIGERRKRYESADELIDALRHPPAALTSGRLRSLEGVHLSFTGILSVTRDVAQRAARRAGAIVHGGPSAQTSVLVRGRPNAQQAAGKDAGLKLMEIKRLREKGHRIAVLNEDRFWSLAGGRPKTAGRKGRKKK